MRRFYCDCSHEVFFENTFCQNCGSALAFDPASLRMYSLTSLGERVNSVSLPRRDYRYCSHRDSPLNCNWLLEEDGLGNTQCISCRLTQTIPAQEIPVNVRRWSVLESAKRRMLYGVFRVGLMLDRADYPYPLRFVFLEDQRSNPEVQQVFVYSGHDKGVITINAAEADPGFREAARVAMNETYRTLLGHFRHEIGHYFWDILVPKNIKAFRALFGDERRDYQGMLDGYYEYGPGTDWSEYYISAYASSHPLEDWAETWAHYMHMQETLDTAQAFGLLSINEEQDFERWMNEWMELSVMLNALNRSIGNSDAYPFVIPEPARSKLAFVHKLVGGYQVGNRGMD